jgi:hypothetical protein
MGIEDGIGTEKLVENGDWGWKVETEGWGQGSRWRVWGGVGIGMNSWG